MRREKHPVAGAKLARLRFTRDEEARGAGDEQHKLVVLLVIPLFFRRGLSGRNDPLDAKPGTPAERLGEFRGKRPRREDRAQGFRLSLPPFSAFNRV
jgi:hypothetical protein